VHFRIKKNTQIEQITNQLHLGQIIKVDVLKKNASSNYIISYKGIELTAMSDIDLFSKLIWLRVTQKAPYLVFQLIVEDQQSRLNELFEYTNDNNLPVPEIPLSIKNLINNHFSEISVLDLYSFLNWFTKRCDQEVLSEQLIVSLFDKGFSINDFLSIFVDINIKFNALMAQTITESNFDFAIIKSLDDIKKPLTSYLANTLQFKISIIERMNCLFEKEKFKLALLYIRIDQSVHILPVELTQSTITGSFITKHYGEIVYKYINHIKKREIAIYFDNLLFLNNLKNYILKATVNKPVSITLGLKKPLYQQNIYNNKKDIKI